MKKSELMIIALLLGLSLLIVPIVSASQMSFPAGMIDRSVPKNNLFAFQGNPETLQFSMHIRAGSQQIQQSNITYDENTAEPGNFTPIPAYRFVMVLPYGSIRPLPIE
jgi:hypothetical protein